MTIAHESIVQTGGDECTLFMRNDNISSFDARIDPQHVRGVFDGFQFTLAVQFFNAERQLILIKSKHCAERIPGDFIHGISGSLGSPPYFFRSTKGKAFAAAHGNPARYFASPGNILLPVDECCCAVVHNLNNPTFSDLLVPHF